jgi:chitosanase
MMNLTPQQTSLCLRVVNVFETGSPEGDYGAISVFADGPHGERQVTYGRSQTTEYGNLEELLQMYVDSGGAFSEELRPFVAKIGVTPLVDDADFKHLLAQAGKRDPVMHRVQDEFFDRRYFRPAIAWADANGFTQPLSALVIYDSQIHSGGILGFLRKRFPERPPATGGDEKRWISQYVGVRHAWLANHQNLILRKTIYRTQCFAREIERANWDLAQLPIPANGVDVGA